MAAVSVTFPLEIITEILSRLPVKPLLQFRCVSKPWCSLIDSKEFVKKHLKESVETKTNLNLILGFLESFSSVSLDSLYPTGSVSVNNVESLAGLPFSGLVMSSSCNGLSLVLIKEVKLSHLFIWNPFSRKYREIHVTPIECPVRLEHLKSLLVSVERYALAYVSETDEYKIVRVIDFSICDGTWWGSWQGSEAQMFSSTSNVWEGIEDFPYRLSCIRGWGAHLNGILHTIVKNGSSTWSIMGFDVKSKQHVVVPSPDFDVCNMASLCVDVLGESLSLTHRASDSTVDVWVMKHYGVNHSWVKLVSVAVFAHGSYSYKRSLQNHTFAYGSYSYSSSVQPLAYSKDGEEVLLNVIDRRLYWYNLRTGTEREVTVNMASEFYTELCFESLVSFPGFISLGNGKGKREGNVGKESRVKRCFTSGGFCYLKDFRLML